MINNIVSSIYNNTDSIIDRIRFLLIAFNL